MDAFSDSGFRHYKPSGDIPWDPMECREINHAVSAVGFEKIGDDIILTVRNSWGDNWGVNGYFKVKASKACGIMDHAWLPELSKPEYINRINFPIKK